MNKLNVLFWGSGGRDGQVVGVFDKLFDLVKKGLVKDNLPMKSELYNSSFPTVSLSISSFQDILAQLRST